MAGIDYQQVNSALNKVFLDGRFAGRPLYLVLDNDGREELGGLLDLPPENVELACCRAVGRSLHQAGDPYWPHDRPLDVWIQLGREKPPTFTALLFALSHAAELMVSDGTYSSGNYYQRLAAATGFDAGKLSLFGWRTAKFWHELRNWLSQKNYAYGRPTARRINSFKHVSLAMSQAIVRAGDRECFHDLFRKYGFSGNDTPSAEEIEPYIASWIHGGAANRRLKDAWQKIELRPRIAEVALAELEAWASGKELTRTATGPSSSQLSLAVSLVPDFPVRKLALSLGKKIELQAPQPLSRYPDDKVELRLDNETYGAFATLSPAQTLDLPDVLLKGVKLGGLSGATDYHWQARLVIPFSRSDDGPYWIEQSRGALGTEHILLVLDEKRIRDAVESVLEQSAVPGYTRARPSMVAGLPSGWLLYEGVRLFRAMDDAPRDAADLSPVAQTGGLKVTGGLRLAPSIWHRRCPPVVSLDGAGQDCFVELLEEAGEAQPGDRDGEGRPLGSAKAVNGSAALELRPLSMPASGQLLARAWAGGRLIGSANLLVRSARRPQPLERQARGRLAYSALDGAREIAEVEAGIPSAEGLASTGDGQLVDERLAAMHARLGTGAAGDEARAMPVEAQLMAMPRSRLSFEEILARMDELACGERGCHYWIAETVPPDQPRSAPVGMECRDCGHAVLVRNRNVARHASQPGQPSQSRVAPPPPAPPSEAAAVPVAGRIDHDLLMDALCFIGSGSWGTFESLVSADIDMPWQATQAAHDLAALGHLDLKRQPGTGRITAWSVPRPVMALNPGGRGFLAGFRNEPMLEEIEARVAMVGGQTTRTALDGQPLLFAVSGLDARLATEAMSGLQDPLGRSVEIAWDAAGSVARACRAMGQAWSLLEPVSLGRAEGVETYDLARNRWRDCDGLDRPGAYRVRQGGQSYVHVGLDGQARRGPHELVKLMAARDAGGSQHCYLPSHQSFACILGCEPQGMLRRALVTCSGELPRAEEGKAYYRDVPPAIAATVLSILYPGVTLP